MAEAKGWARPAPLTLALGVSMTVGYGTLYYPFAILGPEIARSFGWAESFVFGVFSVALLAGALAAPASGRMLDRFGPRLVLMAGSVVAALTLTGLSLVRDRTGFAAAMLLIEAGSTMALYEAGFAALTALHGLGARRHITHVTLIAGFASTIFWPLIQWLLGVTDWRGVCLVLAAVNLLVALPIHAMVPRAAGQAAMPAPPPQGDAPARSAHQLSLSPRQRSAAYALMAVAMASTGFLMSAVHTSFFLIMAAIGRDAALAAFAGAVIGPMQVGARILEFSTGGRISASVVGFVSSSALLGGILLLASATLLDGPWPVLAFAASFGVGQGLAFISRAILPARLFGTHGYGRITGNLSGIRLVFTAAGPFLAALVLSEAGLVAVFVMLTLMALLATGASAALAAIERAAEKAA